MKKKFDYILGDSDYEVQRLAFQAKVWEDMTEGLFDRLRVGPGWRCLEVGPGTGTVFFPLARRVGPKGRVHGVERSEAYAGFLKRQIKKEKLGQARVTQAELLGAGLPRGYYDLVFARWVFLFLPELEKHLQKLIGALRPGGLLAIEDYHREGMGMYPRPRHWNDMMKADTAWFASRGGDISVAGRLPGLYRKLGLELVETRPNVKAGGPESDVWTWAEAYFLGYLDEMAKFPPFNKKKAKEFRSDWLAAKKTPGALFISPAILDVVGRRPI